MSWKCVSAGIGLLAAVGVLAADCPCPDGTWYTLTPMPSRRQEISTAVLNGEIFVIAGYDPAGNSI